jgi:hypothetical protein
MRKLVLTVPLLLLLGSFAKGQECKCLKTPFEPESCAKPCMVGLLTDLRAYELKAVFGLKTSSAEAIEGWENKGNAKSLDDYSAVLSQEEITDLKAKINALTEKQLKYLHKSTLGRDSMRNSNQFRHLFPASSQSGP